jgi:signal transduction histidine kinase
LDPVPPPHPGVAQVLLKLSLAPARQGLSAWNSFFLVSGMENLDFRDLDVGVARARILLSLLAMVSLYVDPTAVGGLFRLNAPALTTLLCHLAYSVGLYFALRGQVSVGHLPVLSTACDLFFATAIAFLTEGQTSPSYVFFVFAIIAVGIRTGLRTTIAATLCGVGLYLLVVTLSDGLTGFYVMRAVYLAIAGYLIGFVGQQRAAFEARMRAHETSTERHSIARSLHDGYVQALAGVNLRLETCRELLARGRPAEALAELGELQNGVALEYDDVRAYIRALAGITRATSREPRASALNPQLQLNAVFTAPGLVSEHILQIMLEGLRNARRHAMASLVTITVREAETKVLITIDDDGIGFADSESRPWAIASRVSQLGGHLRINRGSSTHLEVEMPKTQL